MTGSGNAVVEALPGIVGGLLGGTIAGLLAARAGVGYQQRVAAVTEIRRLALDAALPFYQGAVRMGYTASETTAQRFYDEGFYQIAGAVGVLCRYYGVHTVWLESRVRSWVLGRGYADFREHRPSMRLVG